MSGKAGNTAGKRPPKFIYELPYTVTRELVELLNINDAWETLAGEHLQLKQTEIREWFNFKFFVSCHSSTQASFVDMTSNQVILPATPCGIF